MGWIQYILINVVETCLRMLPIPIRTGLIVLGNPGRNSPVILTCNFHLTVARVKWALRGIDAYLLVANSRGINVWCAATGGLFTNHDVISVLKTSGVEDLVDHRQVILPQLAATGIERKYVRKKTGWIVQWGPVDIKDLPAYLPRRKKTPAMRQVSFPAEQRFEMAVAWAFPISLVAGLILLPLWREGILPAVLLTWGLALIIFMAFPLYQRWLNPRSERIGFVLFDFGRGGVQLILLAGILLGLFAVAKYTGNFSGLFFARWGIMSTLVVLVLSLDLMGSTPLYKSGLHADRFLKVSLDTDKCKGAAFCEQVCPRNCYDVDHHRHLATQPRAHLCVQCGACIVQCPFDALYFESPDGATIAPEIIRKFKLNLMGKRLVKTVGRG
ncbi:MAG: copper oxidase [FCB group bacterium]|nr:copper oxidase [FCB group bacterium]